MHSVQRNKKEDELGDGGQRKHCGGIRPGSLFLLESNSPEWTWSHRVVTLVFTSQGLKENRHVPTVPLQEGFGQSFYLFSLKPCLSTQCEIFYLGTTT